MNDREQRIADLRREIASPRPAHLSEAFHATHIAAAQASLDRMLGTDTDTDTDTRRGSGEPAKGHCRRFNGASCICWAREGACPHVPEHQWLHRQPNDDEWTGVTDEDQHR